MEEWRDKDFIPTFEDRILPVTKAIAAKMGRAERAAAACRAPPQHGRWFDRGDGSGAWFHYGHAKREGFEQLGVTIINPWD